MSHTHTQNAVPSHHLTFLTPSSAAAVRCFVYRLACHLSRINLIEFINEWWRPSPSRCSIWKLKSIGAFYCPPPSHSLKLSLSLDENRMDRWVVSSFTPCITQLKFASLGTGGRSSPVFVLTCRRLKLLDGNFPWTGLNACNAGQDFNFFLLPRSPGEHPAFLCQRVCVGACVSVRACLHAEWDL